MEVVPKSRGIIAGLTLSLGHVGGAAAIAMAGGSGHLCTGAANDNR
jgi:hypothetical protein